MYIWNARACMGVRSIVQIVRINWHWVSYLLILFFFRTQSLMDLEFISLARLACWLSANDPQVSTTYYLPSGLAFIWLRVLWTIYVKYWNLYLKAWILEIAVVERGRASDLWPYRYYVTEAHSRVYSSFPRGTLAWWILDPGFPTTVFCFRVHPLER